MTPFFVGVNLKEFFSYRETIQWCVRLRDIAVDCGNHIELAVMPSFPLLAPALEIFGHGSVGVGAQDLYWKDDGAFTGEVGGALLSEMGCRYVVVGHAERRSLFGETDEIVALKVEASLRNRLCPVICIGEVERLEATAARAYCTDQLVSALVRVEDRHGAVVVAYEPVWAIGADEPAGPEHINDVCGHLRGVLRDLRPMSSNRVIYGGSAGPGLVEAVRANVDGLFLGRRAHDHHSLKRVVDEVGVPS